MDLSHRFQSRQPYQPAPVPGLALDEALQEIRARLGFAPERLYETGDRPIRFGPDKSKRGDKPGWVYVHHYGNGTWSVTFGDWRHYPEWYTWTSHDRHGLTDDELQRHNEKIRWRLELERRRQEGQQAAAARSVQAQWEALPPAPADHPYLVRKGVQPHGLRARAGSLVVPLRDIAGQLWSWQTIDAEGEKRFYKGGRTKGLFFTFAQPGQLEAADTILVCEGWATGATLYEALAIPVVAAMNCGNLLPVVQALHGKYPQCRLVICADDDWQTAGNPGVAKAKEAACSVGAAVAIPVWTGARGEKDTDFNDLARVEGLDTVRRIVEAVLVAPAPESRADSVTDNAPAPDETAGNVPGVPSPGVPDSPGAPDEEKAPVKAKGKAKPKAPVKAESKAKDKAPDKAEDKAVPGPDKVEVKAPVKAVPGPEKAKGKAPAKAEDKAPAKVEDKAPVKAEAKAPVKAKAPAKAKDKAEVKAPDKAKAKAKDKAPGKAEDKPVPGPGKAPDKAEAKAEAKAPVKAKAKAPDKAKPEQEGRKWTFQDSVRFNLEELFGVKLEGPLPYGEYIRFRTSGFGETGWCILYRLPSGVEAAKYGDHLTGVYFEKFSKDKDTISKQEEQRLKEELRQVEQEERQRQEEKQRQAAENAQAEWDLLLPALPDHPYLQSAGVQPYDARVTRKGALCVPLRDTDWQLWNLWFFEADGKTWKVSGGRTRGLFAPFGDRAGFEVAEAILVCQDWLTGALLHEATGRPVAASDRLDATLQALREWLPEKKLAICVDNDPAALEEAEVAKRKIGAVIVTPGEGEPVTFLDLAGVKGREALRQLVDNALRQNPRPGNDERPCFWELEEPMENRDEEGSRQYKPGVYYCGTKPQKVFGQEVRVPIEAWLCSPIRRLARTTEWPNGVQGVRLAVQDGSGWRDVVLPRETLASRRHREILLAYGASLEAQSTDAKAWLVEYLQQPLSRREYTTERTGWHEQQYVFPDVTVGKGAPILFTGARATDKPLTGGELADWQKSVAALAVNNPLLVFSISLAFAGPLLKLVERDAVLVHLVGRSTTGKTTCLLAANSVVGPPELTTTWRATPNGLEQQALAHCDGFWGLDEIGQVKPETLDNAIYTLANGTAKQRAKVYEHGVGAAPMQRWRVAALSTGEKTIETLLAMDKRNVNAGQAVRFIEIPAEERHGAFTELHGYESGAAFADALRRATSRYYGTPIRAFVEQLSGENRDTLNRRLDGCTKYLLEAVKNGGTAPSAQASRILTSMALVALAGEQATAYGITGWSEGEALKAALHCYRLWAQRRAAGTDFETTSVIRLVYDFITRHSDSRFSPIVRGGTPAGNDIPGDEQAGDDIPGGESGIMSGTVSNPVVHHRAGWYRDLPNGDRLYLFTADGFDEAVRGFDPKDARQELKRQGVLIPGKEKVPGKEKNRDSQLVRPGPGYPDRVRVYVISFKALNRALEQVGGCE